MRKTIKLFLLAFFFVGFVVTITSCGKNNNPDDDITDKPTENEDQRKVIYNLAVESGYTGTYEQWLESIKGDYIQLSVTTTYIVWKYATETTWRNLVELSLLTGLQGPAGANGTNGKDGVDGKTPEFRVNAGYLEWKYTTETTWKQLYKVTNDNSLNEGSTKTITVTYVTDWELTGKEESVEDIIVNKSVQREVSVGNLEEPVDLLNEEETCYGWYYYDKYFGFTPWLFDAYYASKDITLYAFYAQKYTITVLNPNGDELTTLEASFGEQVQLPTIEVGEGYEVVYYVNGERVSDNFTFLYYEDVVVKMMIIKNGYNDDGEQYTYNTYSIYFPASWSDLAFQDDSLIDEYTNGNLFSFDYEYDEKGNIVSGGYNVQYDGVIKLEDVTLEYAGQYAIPVDSNNGYAYKITLRDDLKWDDGTSITAEDFVYSFQKQLSLYPENPIAEKFWLEKVIISNAKKYAYQGEMTSVSSRACEA